MPAPCSGPCPLAGNEANAAGAQKWDLAEGLLYVCRKLLSQPYIAPVLSALLYQWMLTHKGAGGAEQQRQKHVNLLVAGAGPKHEHVI